MLKHSSGYTLKKVGNSWYLLPFGQQVADQHKAVVLNETGRLPLEYAGAHLRSRRTDPPSGQVL